MRHGLKSDRVEVLREILGIDVRTLERWRKWWLSEFVQSAFWRGARGLLIPSACEKTLPLSLCKKYKVKQIEQLLDLLKFLCGLEASSAGSAPPLFEGGCVPAEHAG